MWVYFNFQMVSIIDSWRSLWISLVLLGLLHEVRKYSFRVSFKVD